MVVLAFFSGISFLFFGISCFVSPRMKREYVRYGLDTYRTLTGALQIIGGLGQLVGIIILPILGVISSGGLCILMLLGFLVRLKIKDTFSQSLPAFMYAIVNGYLLFAFLDILNKV